MIDNIKPLLGTITVLILPSLMRFKKLGDRLYNSNRYPLRVLSGRVLRRNIPNCGKGQMLGMESLKVHNLHVDTECGHMTEEQSSNMSN